MKNENLKKILKINNLLNHLTIESIHNIKQQNQKMITLEDIQHTNDEMNQNEIITKNI
jgi:hypothetical protein